jgi:integrase
MAKKLKSGSSPKKGTATVPATLAEVLAVLEQDCGLPPTRLRDLRSAVKRVAALVGQEPAVIRFDLAGISAQLARVNPVGAGMTAKRLANIRSDFMAAVKASGLKAVARASANTPMSAEWCKLFVRLSARRAQIGLSRFARYASQEGVAPADVSDQVLDRFIAAVREGSLHRQPNALHRQVALIWNEAARDSDLGLKLLIVPSFRPQPKRVAWDVLTEAFRSDVELYLSWCAVSDPFAVDARPRPLAPRTLRLRRDQIHAAITALVESGVAPGNVGSLDDLVSTENFKRLLRQRLADADGSPNAFNRDLAEALVQIGREWAKLKPEALQEVTRLAGKMPMPPAGLTSKNKSALRQFDDPAVFRRLIDLPYRLWAEVKREAKPNFRTLAKAQAALGIAILSHLPIRPENLTQLTFGVHLFLAEGPGAISTLEFADSEVKNDTDLGFDISAPIARLLIEYRDRIAPKVLSHRPERVFVNADGTAKSQATVAWLIQTTLKRRAGIELTPHQFRHLSAKVILDAEPGSFEAVTQLLGHKNRKTTTNFYAGINSRRAARHHEKLIQRALEQSKPLSRRKKRS